MRIIIFLFLFSINAAAQELPDNYFGQPLPDSLPVLFAPNIISDEFGNRDMAISPKGDEIFYTLQFQNGRSFSTVMHCQKKNGKWSDPAVARFCGRYNDLEPAFSADGKRLYFSSSRPVSGNQNKDYDIWYVTKQNGQWGNPQNMGTPVNTDKNEFYAAVAVNGNIYFTREMEGKDEDIVVCRLDNNKYDTAVSLPGAINTTGAEFNAFVAPDESYIIFTGYKRKNNYGAGDLYISKKNENGEWMEAKNLGDKINGTGITYCPFITPDKKYFFFSSRDRKSVV